MGVYTHTLVSIILFFVSVNFDVASLPLTPVRSGLQSKKIEIRITYAAAAAIYQPHAFNAIYVQYIIMVL